MQGFTCHRFFFLQKRNVHYENVVNTYSFNPTYPLFDFQKSKVKVHVDKYVHSI
jgi:hypothetical protein